MLVGNSLGDKGANSLSPFMDIIDLNTLDISREYTRPPRDVDALFDAMLRMM